jgi:polyisoprenoid-binding protein YceI
MKKQLMLIALITGLFTAQGFSQKFFTQKGMITFFSATSMENIEAKNKGVNSLLDISTGEIAFALVQKSFEFPDKLMQEHFNDKYMESDKYPKSTFEGKITNISSVDFKKDGVYNVTVAGKLSMHGVTKDVSVPGTITIKDGKISANCKFQVKLVDYKIEVPKLVTQKIAESIDVTVEMTYEPYNK